MKKLSVFALILLLTLIVAASASALDLSAYQAAAAAVLPDDAQYVSYEVDDGVYCLKYRVDSTQEYYEIDLDPTTAAIVKKETDSFDDKGGRALKLTEADARSVVLNECAGAQITAVLVDNDDGRYAYKISFRDGTTFATYKVHSETGAVLERDINYVAGSASTEAAVPAGAVTIDAARALVLSRIKNGVIVSIKADKDDGRVVFEGEARDDTYEYDFEILAATGAFLQWETEFLVTDGKDGAGQGAAGTIQTPAATQNSGLIGTDAARSIALKKAGGGRVTSIKLDRDDGVQVYEGKVLTDTYEYEFEMNAATGAIREWDADKRSVSDKKNSNDDDDDDDKDDKNDRNDRDDDHDDDDDDDDDD